MPARPLVPPARPLPVTVLTVLTGLAVTAGLLVPLLTTSPAGAAERRARVAWSDTRVVVGDRATVTVRRAGEGRLVLQRRFPDAWRTADGSARRVDRGRMLRVPTDQLGRSTYRVVAVTGGDRGRVRTVARATTVRVDPTYRPAGRASSYRFLSSPRYRWDSCAPVTWRFHAGPGPRRGRLQVARALARIHAATGLDFSYRGTTDARPRPAGVRRGPDLVIGWVGGREFTRRHGDALGMGGAVFRTGWRDGRGDRVHRAVRGGVVLNARYDDQLRKGFGRGFTWGEVLMHELGHVVGLDHVRPREQMMHDTITRRAARWGAGDLAGLRRVGDRGGCLEPTGGSARSASRLVVSDH